MLDFLLGYTVLVSSDFEGNMLPSEPKQQISKSIYFIGKRIKHKSPDSKNKCWMSDLVISRPTEHSTHTQVNLCIIYFYEAFIYVHNMCCVMSSFFSFGTLLHFPVNIELACGCGGICKACVYFTFASQCVCHVALHMFERKHRSSCPGPAHQNTDPQLN